MLAVPLYVSDVTLATAVFSRQIDLPELYNLFIITVLKVLFCISLQL